MKEKPPLRAAAKRGDTCAGRSGTWCSDHFPHRTVALLQRAKAGDVQFPNRREEQTDSEQRQADHCGNSDQSDACRKDDRHSLHLVSRRRETREAQKQQ